MTLLLLLLVTLMMVASFAMATAPSARVLGPVEVIL